MPIICIALIGLISICVFLNLRKNMLLHFVIVIVFFFFFLCLVGMVSFCYLVVVL